MSIDVLERGSVVARTEPNAELLANVVDAYERGQTVEAFHLAEAIAPLKHWHGVTACTIASRIASNVGARALGVQLAGRAFRLDRNNPEAIATFGHELLGRRGPLALLQRMRGWVASDSAPAEPIAEIIALQARAFALLRDFANAEKLLAQAEAFDPNRPWIRLQRASILEYQDRVEEALEVAQGAMALHRHPYYRPAVQINAHLLQLLDRDDDAIELLQRAASQLQNGPVVGQLYSLLSENGRWMDVSSVLDRYEELSPLLDHNGAQWVRAQRARIAYHLGDRATALHHAQRLDDTFHKEFAERLQQPLQQPERVQLDVTFVRQHFKTCAPATLASIGRYWRLPADHLQLAEAMCYDGTPSWQQREWAEKHGWIVREFRVTHESTLALIERGVPFAISTVAATSAHMMAVIGFDRTRGTLILRDPGQPYVLEPHAEAFFAEHRAFGPRGMVFVPNSEAHRLQGLELPDELFYDAYHRFWLALTSHKRSDAVTQVEQLEKLDADHLVTWNAKLELASYDSHLPEQLRCVDRLLELFPGNAARLLRKSSCLYDAPRAERIAFLEQASAGKEGDPALLVALARVYYSDARTLPLARRCLTRALRFRPYDSTAFSALADVLWEERRLDEATECYRFAATLEQFDERFYQSWFIACRQTRRTDEALTHLADRFDRFGSKSEEPALTLAWAYREMDMPARARDVLERALVLRPDDGSLRLRAAGLLASLGDHELAASLLESVRSKVRLQDLLRARLRIAENALDMTSLAAISRELLEVEPLALDAYGALARSLARREGSRAALEMLRAAAAEHPHHHGLQRVVVEWCRGAGPAVLEGEARKLLALEPADAWARRELALALGELQRGEEAVQEAREALRIEPKSSYSLSVLATVLRGMGQVKEARFYLRQAISIDVDNEQAIHSLLSLSQTDEERREDLKHIEQELIRQVVTGDGLYAYAELARPLIDAHQLLSMLRQSQHDRPDLYAVWSVLVSQLGHMMMLDDALTVAKEATQRFAHLPRTWLDLAFVHRWREELEEETAAAERAFELNPGWTRAAMALASSLERRDQLDAARAVYERALQHSPNDAQLQTFYAHLLWRQPNADAAFAAVERALRITPDYESAWDLLRDWSNQCGKPERTTEFARLLTEERAGEPRVWLMLARVLDGQQSEARLAAVDRALALDPRSTESWDLKAELLAMAERFDDALSVCERGVENCNDDTYILRGRAAWIEAQRNRTADAVQKMRGVLADNKNYLWGWQKLVAWLIELRELNEAATALETMRALRPHDAWVNRQLGLLRLEQKDQKSAAEAFSKVLDVSPLDDVAAWNLLEVQLEDGDVPAAAKTLKHMQLHQPGNATLAAEVQVRLREHTPVAAKQAFAKLCASPDPEPWAMNVAANAFVRAKQIRDAIEVLKSAIESGSCNPQCGAAAVRLMMLRNSHFLATWLFLQLPAGEMQRRAASSLVHGIAENDSKWLFRWLMNRRRDVLYEDDAAWGQVSYALTRFNRMKDTVKWMRDWQRPRVEPWMLYNLCLALRYTGHHRESTEIATHALRTWSHRDGAADLHLFVAIEAALAGRSDLAKHHLEQTTVNANALYEKQLAALTRLLIQLEGAPDDQRAAIFAQQRTQLDPLFGPQSVLQANRDVRETLKRAARRVGALRCGFRAIAWFRYRLHWQWSLLVLVPPSLALLSAAPILLWPMIWILYALFKGRGR